MDQFPVSWLFFYNWHEWSPSQCLHSLSTLTFSETTLHSSFPLINKPTIIHITYIYSSKMPPSDICPTNIYLYFCCPSYRSAGVCEGGQGWHSPPALPLPTPAPRHGQPRSLVSQPHLQALSQVSHSLSLSQSVIQLVSQGDSRGGICFGELRFGRQAS